MTRGASLFLRAAAGLALAGCFASTPPGSEGGQGTSRLIRASAEQILDAARQLEPFAKALRYPGAIGSVEARPNALYLCGVNCATRLAVITYTADANGNTRTEVVSTGYYQPVDKPTGELNLLNAIAASIAPASAGSPASAVPIRSYSSDVDRPKLKLGQVSGAYAVVIGVEKYANDLPDAKFAERDAQAVRASLVALGYPERNIKLLTGARATKSNLEAYLEDWLPRNVGSDGEVFIYFSGHGAPDPASNQAFLVPFDGNPNYLEKTSYPVKKLYAGLGKLKAKQIVVALDSCFSGAGGRSVLADGARPLVAVAETAVAHDSRITLFAAASPKEITATLNEQGHGIFTYYFLKGLQGEAKDGAGAVTARSLYDYLRPQVQDAASRQNRDQTPMLEGAADRELVRFR